MVRVRKLLLLAALILTFFSWRTLLKPGYFSMHDDMQAFRALEMDKCWRDGQIPCRWIPDGGFGYGYPLFNFYPPLPFYLTQLTHLLGFALLPSVKIVFILGFVVAAGTMFLLGEALWGPWGGFLASVFYTFAPYHATDIYARGAMNEFLALAWFPAIFWAIFRFVKTEKKRYLTWFAFFYGLLFLTHNLMVFIFTPVAVLWLFLNLALERKLKLWRRFIKPALLAIGLAAFFLLPVVFEKKLVHVETMLMGYFNYLAHFVSLKQLFLSRAWGYGASVWGEGDTMSFQIGFLHWGLAFAIAFLGALFLKKKKERGHLLRIFFIFLFGLAAAFLTHSRSTFLWKVFKPLEYLQFPWRFLALVIFSFSLLVGALAVFLSKLKSKLVMPGLVLLLAILVIAFNVSYFKEDLWYWGMRDEDKFGDSELWEKQVTSGIFDYLPKSAEFPPGEAAPEMAWFEEGKGEISAWQKGTNWLKFTARVESREAQVRIPVYYFPNWTVWVDGEKAGFDSQNKLGLPTLELTKGSFEIEARFKNTPVRMIGNLTSLLSWAFLVGSVLKYGYGKRRSSAGS